MSCTSSSFSITTWTLTATVHNNCHSYSDNILLIVQSQNCTYVHCLLKTRHLTFDHSFGKQTIFKTLVRSKRLWWEFPKSRLTNIAKLLTYLVKYKNSNLASNDNVITYILTRVKVKLAQCSVMLKRHASCKFPVTWQRILMAVCSANAQYLQIWSVGSTGLSIDSSTVKDYTHTYTNSKHLDIK